MNPQVLQLLHVSGVIALFAALGSILSGSEGSCRKRAMIMHGVSLLFVLVIGFAMLKKPPMGQYWWMVKIGLWLFIGAAPALSRRHVMPRCAVMSLCIAAAIAAAYLGMFKPF